MTSEQDEIAATASALLADRVPVVGRGHDHVAATEIDAGLWQTCADLGWLGLGLPEAQGGVGFGLTEEAVLFRELGRYVVPGPFLPGVLGAQLAAAAGDGDLAASIASGAVRVALGTTVGVARVGAVSTAQLSLAHVEEAALVVVADDGGAALVDIDACGVEVVDPVEGTVSAGRGRIEEVAAVASVDAATAPIFLHGLVLAAAISTGVAEAAMAVAVEYAGQRIQFGKPIGVNQAIKHRCADMAVRSDGAWSQVCYAAVAVSSRLPGAAEEAAIAKYFADEAARTNAAGAVQVHGAIGFTSEATPHRYVNRAHLMARTLASRAALLDRVVGRS